MLGAAVQSNCAGCIKVRLQFFCKCMVPKSVLHIQLCRDVWLPAVQLLDHTETHLNHDCTYEHNHSCSYAVTLPCSQLCNNPLSWVLISCQMVGLVLITASGLRFPVYTAWISPCLLPFFSMSFFLGSWSESYPSYEVCPYFLKITWFPRLVYTSTPTFSPVWELYSWRLGCASRRGDCPQGVGNECIHASGHNEECCEHIFVFRHKSFFFVEYKKFQNQQQIND